MALDILIGGPGDGRRLSVCRIYFCTAYAKGRVIKPVSSPLAAAVRNAGVKVTRNLGVLYVYEECYITETFDTDTDLEWKWLDSEEARFALAQEIAASK